MTRAILNALVSHWWRNPLQLGTLLLGLALGTALWSGVQAINAEAHAGYDAAAATLSEGRLAQITAAGGGPIAQADYLALRRGGWLVSPVVEGKLEGVRLLGIEPLTAPAGIAAVPSDGADLSAFLSGGGQIFAQSETLARLPETGASKVVARDIAPGTAITDIGVAQRVLGRPDQINRLLVAPEQPLGQAPLAEIAPDLILQRPEAGNDMARLTESFHLNLTAFGLLAFAVGLFIVHGAIGLAFEQRRPMLRTLRALGAPLRWLIGLMALELLLLALLAGGIGVALGYMLAAALLPDVAATLGGLYGAEVSGQLAWRPEWWLSGMGIAVGGAAVAAIGALAALARMPLLAGGQPRAWAMARGGGRRAGGLQAGAAVALLLLAALLALGGQGLPAGFVMLAALLIGGALALPPLLALALWQAEARARRPVVQWFWADTRQQLPGLSLALMALLLAMAANIGVSTMVSSFRLTFVEFLDQRLAAELYVSAATPTQAAAIVALADRDATALLPLLTADARVAGQPVTLMGLRDHETYRDNWRFLRATPDVWAALSRDEGVLVNEQLYRRAGLDLGVDVTLHDGARRPVLGIYGDYGNPVGQVIVSESAFMRLHPEVQPSRFGLRLDPAKLPALRTALKEQAGLADEAIIDQAAIKALSLEVFERTFLVTAALNILTLAVAAVALLLSLLTLAALRLPQLAPVWALGLTRRHLAALELLRALVLAALCGALALPLGLTLAWALLAVVNVEAFGWRLPMALFPRDYVQLWALALMAAALAACWPAWRLARMAPTHLLGVFRHER